MKYNVFAYIGSGRGNNSNTKRAVMSLLDHLMQRYNLDLKVTCFEASKVNIKNCMGCGNCFAHGSCVLADDMERIKNAMVNSDIIILATPVYFHHVSGSTKTLIDRIAYWSHVMKLSGKLSIPIAVEDTNGGELAADYLDKVLQYMGTSVLSKIVISAGRLATQEAFDSVVRIYARQIIKNMDNPSCTALQEQYFEQLKQVMRSKEDQNVEKKYWVDNNLFSYLSFQELFVAQNAIDNKGGENNEITVER